MGCIRLKPVEHDRDILKDASFVVKAQQQTMHSVIQVLSKLPMNVKVPRTSR